MGSPSDTFSNVGPLHDFQPNPAGAVSDLPQFNMLVDAAVMSDQISQRVQVLRGRGAILNSLLTDRGFTFRIKREPEKISVRAAVSKKRGIDLPLDMQQCLDFEEMPTFMFACPTTTCSMGPFESAEQCKQHCLQVHRLTEEAKFSCPAPQCTTTYTELKNLKRHFLFEHGAGCLLMCVVCGRLLTREDHREEHLGSDMHQAAAVKCSFSIPVTVDTAFVKVSKPVLVAALIERREDGINDADLIAVARSCCSANRYLSTVVNEPYMVQAVFPQPPQESPRLSTSGPVPSSSSVRTPSISTSPFFDPRRSRPTTSSSSAIRRDGFDFHE